MVTYEIRLAKKYIYEGDDSARQIDISKYRQNFYLHGKCSDWNEDGQLTSELKYKNGQGWDGFWTKGIWGKQDLGISQGQFIKGKKDGRWIASINPERFDENGNIIYLDSYLNNPLWIDEDNRNYGDKFFTYFSKREINYRSDKLHGKMIYWNSDGQIEIESNYKNDLLDGLDIEYENANDGCGLERRSNYSKGVQQGKETLWHENGQIYEESNYSKGVKHGKETVWYKNGQIESEVNYKDGKKDGKWTVWYDNGQKESEVQDNLCQLMLLPMVLTIKQETHYKNDEKHGTFTKWSESGSKEEEGNYKNDKLNGEWLAWHDNGRQSAGGNYLDGKKDGQWWYVFEDGCPGSTTLWKDGKNITYEDGMHF